MIGPVCYLELLPPHRRGRQRLFRRLYGGFLAAELGLFLYRYLLTFLGGPHRPHYPAAGDFVNNYVEVFMVQQYVLLLLVLPAFAAGSITDEKTRGTLQGLLITELSSWEIILGKLLGQLALVLDLAILGLPPLCFVAAVGSVEPGLVLAIFLSPLLPLVAVGSASLLASVWFRSTSEAVLALYLIGSIAVLCAWGLGGQDYLDPRYVLGPAWEDADWREWGRRWLQTGAVWGGLALVCLVLAIWRLRPSYVRQLVADRPRDRRWNRRPPVDDVPVRWKARYAERLISLPGLRALPKWFGVGGAFVAGVLLPGAIVLGSVMRSDADALFFELGMGTAFLASLLVGVACSGTVSGERERQTWDPLLLTPLEGKQLVRGKLWGVIDSTRPYMIAYGVPALVISGIASIWAAFWTLCWWLTAWVLMYHMAGQGVASSVHAASSWQALLRTLTAGYLRLLGWLVAASTLGYCSLCLFCMGGLIVSGAIEQMTRPGSISEGVLAVLALVLFLTIFFTTIGSFIYSSTEKLLQETEEHIDRKERLGLSARGSPWSHPQDFAFPPLPESGESISQG
jgi:ABC-type transport system involved in multi-copper enzyme maturation permease subunit